MNETKFDEILRDLESANCLRLDRSGEQLAIDAVTSTSVHFQPDDPLVGAHQLLVRQQAEARKSLIDPGKKTTFQVTFTGDAATFDKCRAMIFSSMLCLRGGHDGPVFTHRSHETVYTVFAGAPVVFNWPLFLGRQRRPCLWLHLEQSPNGSKTEAPHLQS